MLVLLKKGATETAVGDAAARLRMLGLAVHRNDHEGRVRLGAVGDGAPVDWEQVRGWPMVQSVEPIPVAFKLVSRIFQPRSTVLSVGRCAVGSEQLVLM